MDWKDRKVLVLGLGDTGLSMARWLDRSGARVSVADTRSRPPHAARLAAELPHVPMKTGAFDAGLFGGVDAIAISPGIDPRESSDSRSDSTRCADGRRHRAFCGRHDRPRAPAFGAEAQGARHHRIERQEHGHRDDRRHVALGRPQHDRRRQHRSAGARCARRDRSRRPVAGCLRPRAFELPARNDAEPRTPMRRPCST